MTSPSPLLIEKWGEGTITNIYIVMQNKFSHYQCLKDRQENKLPSSVYQLFTWRWIDCFIMSPLQ